METATDTGDRQGFTAWTRRHRIWSRLAPLAPALLFGLTWFAFSGPVVYVDLLVPAFFGWFIFACIWALLLAAESFKRRFRRGSFNLRPWLYFPAFLTITVVSSWVRAPFWAGYLASRPAMDQVAHEVMAGKRDPSKIRWIGIYPVTSAWRNKHGFAFYVNGTGESGHWNDYFDEWGFLYSETPPRMADYGYCGDVKPFHHLTGHWYKVELWSCGA